MNSAGTNRKVLLLGATGKMGCALRRALGREYELICKNSRDFEATDFRQVRKLIDASRPDVVLNTVAFLGIEPCERQPAKANIVNARFPELLAELSGQRDYLLVHFSTDAVFDGSKRDYYHEDDTPTPVNVYGETKHRGDCRVREISPRHYLVRVSTLFGETERDGQFVEKMLARIARGEKKLRVADDIVLSPTYALDAALKTRELLESGAPFGLYHVANQGRGSLYELMAAIVDGLGLEVDVEKGSHCDFPAIGRKNTFTPLSSTRTAPLRPWRQAVADYCGSRRKGESRGG